MKLRDMESATTGDLDKYISTVSRENYEKLENVRRQSEFHTFPLFARVQSREICYVEYAPVRKKRFYKSDLILDRESE